MENDDLRLLQGQPGLTAVRQAIARFIRFVLLGGLAAVVNFGSRFVFSLAMPFEAAVICAYVVAAATGFILFSLFVFPGSPRPKSQQTFAFLAVSAAGMALTWIVSVTLLRFIFPAIAFSGPREAVAHALGLAVPIVTSYYGHKRFTFGG